MRELCNPEIVMEFLNSYGSILPLMLTEADDVLNVFSNFLKVVKCG